MRTTSRQSISESLTEHSAALGEVMAQLDNADVCVIPQLKRSHTLQVSQSYKKLRAYRFMSFL